MAETVFNNINPVMMERIKNLRLIDDELMTVVFSGDKKATELLIRIRYHQAMLDSHTLKKQEDFEKLPNLYIIFILEHDLFGKDDPIYFVNKTLNINDEDGNPLLFDDGCNIMYVNGEYTGDDALGKLMHDFSTPNADEMYYTELAADAFKQGIQQGAKQQAIEDAIEFLKEEIPPEKVAKCVKLPIEKVLELQSQLPKKA